MQKLKKQYLVTYGMVVKRLVPVARIALCIKWIKDMEEILQYFCPKGTLTK